MKKIIITLISLIVLSGSALAFFIATFDAEHYRPLIESKAAELTGFPVQLGGVSLTWKNGIALEVNDLALKVRQDDQGPAPVSVRRAYMALEVMPLLRGTVQIGSVLVEDPEVLITRAPDGRLRGAAELGAGRSSQKSKTPSGVESTLVLLIQNLTVRGGRFVFQDQTGGQVRDYVAEQVELRLRDVSLLSPFPVELKASVFSGKQNILLSGKVHVRLTQQEVNLSGFSLSTDLDALDVEKLAKVFPELKKNGMPMMAGQVNARLSDVTLSEKSAPALKAKIDLTRGSFAAPDTETVENIEMSSEVTEEGLEITSLEADWSGGHLASSAKVDWRKAPLMNGSFQSVLSGLNLTRAVPASPKPQDPAVAGMLSANLRGTFSGIDADAITLSLSGDGQVSIKEGVIQNLNVLNEVLSKLSIIPGVSQKIQSRLSEEYLKKLQERDTRLEDVNLPVRIQGGSVFLDSISIQSDTFKINGQAQAAMAGPLHGRLFAAIDPEFSTALMRSVNELQYIADQNGQITVPIMLRGTLEKPEVIPEVQQLASRLAASKAQELISGFLNKNKQPETGTADGSAEQGTQPLETSTGGASSYQQQNTRQQPTDPFAALLGQVIQAAASKKQE